MCVIDEGADADSKFEGTIGMVDFPPIGFGIEDCYHGCTDEAPSRWGVAGSLTGAVKGVEVGMSVAGC